LDQPHRQSNRAARSLSGALVVVIAVLALAIPAGATPIPGENGRIAFVSRQNLGQAGAEIFFLPVPSSTGGGTLSAPIASNPALRHRHPTWSPDRTKIAYARGTDGTPNSFDIWIQDLTQPLSATNPTNVTSSAGSSEDRPAWSPEGNHLAYERDSGVPADRDVVVSLLNGGGSMPINGGAGIEGQPAWSPDSKTLYYEDGNAQNSAVDTDIVKCTIDFGPPISCGGESPAVAEPVLNKPEIQPAISPDGTKICFGTGYPGAPSTDIRVASLTGAPVAGNVVSVSPVAYECTWSPDNTLVAYTAGGGATGDLVMVKADGSLPIEFPLATGTDIQTNPDWAPDGRPECPDSTAETTVGTPISIPVECTDTGPAYERTNVREFITQQPTNGTTDQPSAGDPVAYTPNPGFIGTDTFEIGSFDELGFGSDKGTVTVKVLGRPCGGTTATIASTEGDDVITGTPGPDVIAGLGGNDRIKGANGKDILCGGLGNDNISGGKGKDRLIGGKGKDKLNGGKSKDRCSGGPQKDRIKACE
jgi:hypothetical protein